MAASTSAVTGMVRAPGDDGTKAVTLYATYLGVPKTSKPNVPGTQPSGCKA